MKKKMRRIFAIFLTTVMILSLTAACSKGTTDQSTPDVTSSSPEGVQSPTQPVQPTSSEPSVPPEQDAYVGKTLTVAMGAEPTVLLPQAGIMNNGASTVVMAMADYLFFYNENGEIVPSIATGSEWVDDLHLRIFLRNDVYSSQGYHITAEDVLFSWQLGKNLGLNARSYTADYDVDGWTVEDDYTLVMKLNVPCATILDGIVNSAFVIVSKQAYEEFSSLDDVLVNPQVYTGRYKFVEWVPGQYVLLEYNKNYWDHTYVPSFLYIRFTWVADSAARTMAVQSGAADIAEELSRADVSSVEGNPGLNTYTIPANTVVGMYFNCSRAPLDDARVRRAIRMLIDPAAVQSLFGGDIVESVVSSNLYLYWKEGAAYIGDRSRNIAGAKALLAEAGYPDGFELDALISTAANYPLLAQLIQANLADAGIKVNIVQTQQSEFFSRLDTADYDLLLRNAGSATLQIQEWRRFDRNTEVIAARGHTLYANPALDDLINTWNTNFDADIRLQAAYDIQKILIDDAPAIGFTNAYNYAVSTNNLTNAFGDSTSNLFVIWIRPVN